MATRYPARSRPVPPCPFPPILVIFMIRDEGVCCYILEGGDQKKIPPEDRRKTPVAQGRNDQLNSTLHS